MKKPTKSVVSKFLPICVVLVVLTACTDDSPKAIPSIPSAIDADMQSDKNKLRNENKEKTKADLIKSKAEREYNAMRDKVCAGYVIEERKYGDGEIIYYDSFPHMANESIIKTINAGGKKLFFDRFVKEGCSDAPAYCPRTEYDCTEIRVDYLKTLQEKGYRYTVLDRLIILSYNLDVKNTLSLINSFRFHSDNENYPNICNHQGVKDIRTYVAQDDVDILKHSKDDYIVLLHADGSAKPILGNQTLATIAYLKESHRIFEPVLIKKEKAGGDYDYTFHPKLVEACQKADDDLNKLYQTFNADSIISDDEFLELLSKQNQLADSNHALLYKLLHEMQTYF